MTDPNPDIDERLARLAARRNPLPSPSPATARGNERRRRRHPAAAGRILSVGLSSSAFLSLVATFAQTHPSGASITSLAAAPVTTPSIRTRIVVRDVHHTIYVDQFGRPIDDVASLSGVSAPTPSGAHTATGAKSPAATTDSPSPVITPGATGVTAPNPPGAARQLPGSGTAPTTIPAARPTTPTTRPPAPPTTVVTIPPPPPPPPCTGSKCK